MQVQRRLRLRMGHVRPVVLFDLQAEADDLQADTHIPIERVLCRPERRDLHDYGERPEKLRRLLMIGLLVCASLTAVDGDTVKCDGQNLRDMGDGAPFVSGYDTPEIGKNADCDAENALGEKAKRRMAELLLLPV